LTRFWLASTPLTVQAPDVASPSRRTLSALALLSALVLGVQGCKEEEQTINVPFDGPDAPLDPKRSDASPGVAPSPPVTATAEASATPGGYSSAASIQACCQALRTSAKAAKDEAARANLTSAANACDTQRVQLEQGKVTRTQALLAVRLSLLDQAPGACR